MSDAMEVDGTARSGHLKRGARKRIVLIASLACVLIVGAAVGVILWLGPAGSADPDAQAAAHVISQLPSDPVVGVDAVTATIPDLDAFFPDGMTVDPLADSWRTYGADGGLMDVTVSSSETEPRRFTAVLTRMDDEWRVVAFLEDEGEIAE